MKKPHKPRNTYIDLFSGCGGLSLGLGNAGWEGIFAVEKDDMAFDTFKHNLIDGKYNHFNWPEWLPQKATTIQTLLENYKDELLSLSGKIDLIAGGPPCQGFSLAGRRNPNDPRNTLSNQYIKMVELVNPKYLLLENVRGFNAKFNNAKGKKGKIPYSEIVKAKLENLGYTIFTSYLSSQNFGVPQQRTRFIMIGIKTSILKTNANPFDLLEEIRSKFIQQKGLSLKPVTVKQAINDLEHTSGELVYHSGSLESGFKKLDYIPPRRMTAYQKVMRKGLNGRKPNGLRIPRHKDSTVTKFKLIQDICTPGALYTTIFSKFFIPIYISSLQNN